MKASKETEQSFDDGYDPVVFLPTVTDDDDESSTETEDIYSHQLVRRFTEDLDNDRVLLEI